MKAGEIALKHGLLQAFFKMPTPLSTARIPTYVVRYQFFSDISNESGVLEVAKAVGKQLDSRKIPGTLWSSAVNCGWAIDNADELLDFATTLWNYSARPDFKEYEPMTEAWLGCVKELPKFARARAGGSYKPREHLPVRMQALEKFYLTRLAPEPKLPPHYFDDQI